MGRGDQAGRERDGPSPDRGDGKRGRIPTWLKVIYTGFVALLVPVYTIEHGLANFLWFSNIALLSTAAALWLEWRLLAAMQAVSVVLLEMGWIADFLIALVSGDSLIGLTAYMFDASIPLFVRGLSLYHMALPFLLLWIVLRLGYDRRAWRYQTGLAWCVLLICYAFTEPDDNINWTFGLGNEPQSVMPPALYLLLVMAGFPALVYLPTHLLLGRLAR